MEAPGIAATAPALASAVEQPRPIYLQDSSFPSLLSNGFASLRNRWGAEAERGLR